MIKTAILACIFSFGLSNCSTTKSDQIPLPQGFSEFKDLSPDAKSDADLAPILKLSENAEIIGLGEAAHTSEAFYQIKARIVKTLVTKGGVRSIAFEDSFVSVEAVNQYILSGKGSSKEALQKLYTVWHSKTIADLFDWLRDYNKDHPTDPVKIFGFDFASGSQTLAALSDYTNNDLGSLQKEIKSCSYLLDNVDKADETICKTCIDLGAALAQESKLKFDRTAGLSLGFAAKRACNFKNANKRNAIRDEGMAALLTAKLKDPTTIKKTLIWSANPHLQKIANHPTIRPMGSYIQESFKGKYKVINVVADRYETHPDFSFISPQAKSLPGTPEEWLATYNRDRLFVDLNLVTAETLGLSEENKAQATSYIDAIVYLKSSPAMKIYK